MNMQVLEGLNDEQKQAVLTVAGPVLILAGAGSGKTKALTHRVAYLIYEKKVYPQNILAVTFTNKAAGEMRERVDRLLMTVNSSPRGDGTRLQTPNIALPWLGTFHSICVKILRREINQLGFDKNFSIFDEADSLRAVKNCLKDLDIDETKFNPKAILYFISGAKNELLDAKSYKKYASDYFQEVVARVFERYEKLLKKSNALDFDDLILKTVELLQSNPQILDKYQDRFRYILVDEYQDTNHAQYTMLNMLAKKHHNIFVIGDDWQSIYSFRGAKFQNILDFRKDYADAKVIYLEKNYRSLSPILDAAQAVIEHNELRSTKKIFSSRGGGAPVMVIESSDKINEINFILDEIESLAAGESRQWSDFVVLYRINSQSRLFEEALLKRGLPYRLIGGVRFYERKEIKDMIGYLRLLVNPSDTISLSRVVNSPPRGIGTKGLEKILLDHDSERANNKKYAKFCDMIDNLRLFSQSSSLPDLIEQIILRSGYKEHLSDRTIESQSRLENIEELKSAASEYEILSDFLQSVSLIADVDKYSRNEDALTLMTVHSAKGLEFPVVFISGLEEGVFPHSRSAENQADLEEERRLLYVGMTRAMDRLYLCYSKTRFVYGRMELCVKSRFVDELPENDIELLEI